MTDRRRRAADASRRNAATCLAMSALLAGGIGFLAFTAVILPQIRWVMLVIGGVTLFFLLHYFTWGRWMSRLSDDADDWAPPETPDDRHL